MPFHFAEVNVKAGVDGTISSNVKAGVDGTISSVPIVEGLEKFGQRADTVNFFTANYGLTVDTVG